MSTTVPKAPTGAVPAIGVPDSQDYPRLVYTAPYFAQTPLAELIEPSVIEAAEAVLPELVPPYVQGAADAAVDQRAVLLTGSTMSGPLYLNPAIPTQPSQAASMAYVDMMVSTGPVPEVPPVPFGQTWARQTGAWVPSLSDAASDGAAYGRQSHAWQPVLPIAGGTLTGSLGFWGASAAISSYDAQISVTGGATLPGNPNQGSLRFTAGDFRFSGPDGTTNFYVLPVAQSYDFWAAVGASQGTAATLTTWSGVDADVSGAISAQGHGSLSLGNAEGTIAQFANIGVPIVSYFQFQPAGYNQIAHINVAGGNGLPCSLALTAGYYGGIVTSNLNGPLAIYYDPAGANNAPRTTYFTFTAGSAGISPIIGVSSGGVTPAVTADSMRVNGLGNGSVILGNNNGIMAACIDPAAVGGTRTSHLAFTAGAAGFSPTISVIGDTLSSDALALGALGAGGITLQNGHGSLATVTDPGTPRTSYLTFAPGTTGISPTIGVTGATVTADALNVNALGNGGIILQNGNGRLLVLTDGQATGSSQFAYIRVTPPGTAAGALSIGLTSVGSGANNPLNLASSGTGEVSLTTGGGKQARAVNVVSATRSVDFYGGGGGVSASVKASTGNLYVGGAASPLGTTATTGFIQIPTCAGTPTGVPDSASNGATMVYDTTNHFLRVYDTTTSTWRGVALT